MPPKGRKGRKGGDSDDDPLADQLAHLKTMESNNETDKNEESNSTLVSKKDKKALKQSGKHDDDENDHETGKPGKTAAVKKGKHDVDQDDAPKGKVSKSQQKEAAAEKAKAEKAAIDNKKPTKKGGKRGKYSDSESDNEKPTKSIAVESDDDEPKSQQSKKKNDKKSAPTSTTATNKKNKNKGKGRKNESSDDEDPLAKLKQLALNSDDDEDEEDASESEDEKPVVPPKKQEKQASTTPAACVLTSAIDNHKNDKPSGKGDKKGNKQTQQQSKGNKKKEPTPPPSSDEESEVESDEEEEEVVPEPVVVKKSDKKDSKSKTEKQSVKETVVSVPEPVAALVAAPIVPAVTPTPLPTPPPAASSSNTKGKSNVVVPPPAPVVEPVKAVSNKPKSKLELKLEKAKQDKAAADALAAEAARVEAIAAAERERVAKIEKDRVDAENARIAAELAAAKAEEESSDDEDEEDGDTFPSAESALPKTQEEKDAEARMMATMYGDEVFSEYNTHDPKRSIDNDDGETPTKMSLRDKKLSNKAKRKLVKEHEAKEREIEFNAAAMKASIEGAQFAVSQSIVDVNDPQWQNALDIIIPSISISAHSKELFVNTELSIVHGRRYGLVGPNGAGKSTLLKMISSGELKIPPRVDYLYVEQEVLADETPAVDAVLKADKVRWELVQEEKKLLADLEKNGPNEAKDVRLGEVYEQLANIGAASAESRARRILFGLGFDREMQVRPTKYFSGGWRMRISLARALFIEPTLLMLDEPTNHLDLNAVIWLDDYLQKWKKTLLVVSHDQDFLNSVCQEVLHLNEKKLETYKGNYDNFKEQEAVKRRQQQKDWEKQEKKLRELKAKGVTKQNAEKAQLKAKSREPGARSKKQEAASMSSGGISSEDSQVHLINRPRDYTVVFSFPEVIHLSPPILEVRDVNFQYAPNLPWLFKGLNFGLDMQSRVCIVGPNGSGKSTVIKLITEELKPPEGEVRRNPRLRVGVYNQHFVDRLPMEEDPVTYLRRLYSEETYQSCRNKLGKYGLEGHAHTIPIRDLSGGQKARVVFVELSLMAPHLLFLDEPTNNLDIESIDALCIALKEFNGGVVMVSHDARLIESTDCQLWVVEDQNVTPWASGFAGYREHLLKKLEEQLNAIMPGSGERPV